MSKISVIVPVYNCETTIKQCIESVLKQTFADFELLLVDDGSSDRSGEICDDYARKDARVGVIHKSNGNGAGEARNKGLECVLSPFVTFLDSDDWLQEDMLEKLWDAQQKDNSDVVICGYRNIVSLENPVYNFDTKYPSKVIAGKQAVREYFVEYFPEGMVGYPWNKLYRTDIIRKHALMFPKMRRLEDGIFNIDFFSRAECICVIEDVLYNYRASQQVEQRKLPRDFYDLMEAFVNYYYRTLKQWGFQISDVEKPVVFYFLNDFVGCLENICYSPQFKNEKERRDMLETLRNKRLVVYMLRQERAVGRYPGMVLSLFEKKYFKRMQWIIKLKILLKVRLYIVFQWIKKVAN